MTLIHGGCICIPSEEERGSDLPRAIKRLDANWTFLTSTVLANLHPEQVPSLKTICVGGEPIRTVQIREWADHVHLRQTYGSAELSGVVGSAYLGADSELTDVGKAISARIWLVDSTDVDRLSPIGVPGEIIIEGPTVGREYIGQPDKTAAAFIQKPAWRESFGRCAISSRFYKTGDLAVYKSNGAIQLLGRKDTQIKLRGQRIEVGEVEQQARQATAEVQEVAVELTTFPGATRGPELVGFLVLRKSSDQRTVSQALRAVQCRLESMLPHYMVPSLLVPIPELPLTASKKTDRRRLREMGTTLSLAQLKELKALAAGEKRQPTTEGEKQLLEHWAEVLNIDPESIGIDDSFFRLGGDSVAAMRLTVMARKSGLSLAVADIFRNPTLVAQAQVVANTAFNANESTMPFSLVSSADKAALVRGELAALCGVDDSLVVDAYPCTPLQEGLLSLTAKRSGDYVLQAVLEFNEVDIDAFRKAWESTVAEIDVLRTRIVDHAELGLTQVVCNGQIDWTRAPDIETYMAKDKASPMEPGQPLSRYATIGNKNSPTHFVWTVHHALFDGWCLPLILDAVHNAYLAKPNERPTGFNSFVRYISTLPEKESSQYWESYLADGDFAPFPPLPPYIQEPAADATLEMVFSSLVRSGSTNTPSVLIRGALGLLIHQYTGSSDVLLGSTVSGRNAPVPGVHEIIGPTIATVPIRMQLSEDQNINSFLESVQQDATDMIAYEQTGLQRIAKVNEDGKEACRFQTLLVIHPNEEKLQPDDDTRLGKWRTSEDNNEGFSTHAITLECYLADDAVTMKATYDSRVVKPWKMKQMLQNLDTILTRLVDLESSSAAPPCTIREICRLSTQDAVTIRDWNKDLASMADTCIHNAIEAMAMDYPEAPAIQSWDGSLTYQELDELADKLAAHLSSFGVGPEIVVPICSEKSLWTVVSLFAVMKAGGAFVLLDLGLPYTRLQKLCRQVKATTALTSVSCKTRLSDFVTNSITVSWDLLNQLPESEPVMSDVSPTNAAYIIFTSGSTGEPKGVIIEHRSYCSAAKNHGSHMNMSRKTRSLQFGSYSFAGSIMEMMMTMLHGGCVCILSEEQRGTQLVETIRDLNANWAFLTSTVLANMTPEQVPSLKTVCVGGEAIRAAQIKQWESHCDLRQTYGSAETGAVVSSASLNSNSTTADVGKATTGKYWIVDPRDSDYLVPVGAPGEVIIEGPTIGREYIDNPEKSAATFITAPTWRPFFGPLDPACRFYKTGDLAAYTENGSIQLLGRKDTQVKLRGQRIETGEVEYHAKVASTAILQAVVDLSFIHGSASKGPELVGFLVIETSQGNPDYRSLQDSRFDGETCDAIRAVLATLERALPYYMVPSLLVPIQQLPLTVSGKTDRRRLREMGSNLSEENLMTLKSAMRGDRRGPQTETESTLRALWSDVLGLEESNIGMDDSFFRLGGDSVSAMKLVGAARKSGISFTVADIFRTPILAAQATIRDNEEAMDMGSIEPFSLLTADSVLALVQDLAALCDMDASHIEDAYPCTPLQEGLLSLTTKRAGEYTMQAVLELSEDIDLVSFKAAWGEVVLRNPVLRTRIVHHTGLGLVQVVCDEGIEWTDIKANLDSYMATDKATPMALGDKLARFAIIHQGNSRNLVWTLHHAMYDGWSFPILVEMAGQAYEGKTNTRKHRTEFNAFVKQISQPKYKTEAQAYWPSYFADGEFMPFPTLPPSCSEPKANDMVEFSVAIGSNTESTISTMVRGAMALMISAYTGSSDIIFGATVSGRNAPVAGIEDIVGPTIATVPIRAQVKMQSTVSEFLRQIQQDATEMIAYEQTGLSRIAKMDENCREACNFQTLLVVQPNEDTQVEDNTLGKWKTESEQDGFVTYALVMECIIGDGDIKLRASFDSTIISNWQMQNMAEQVGHILKQLATATSDQILSGIDIVTPKDEAILQSWNGSVPASVETHIHETIAQNATTIPDDLAVSSWDGDLTYAELDRLSSQLAYSLVEEHGLQTTNEENVVVPLCFEKSKWTVVAMLAVLKAGAAFLLVDPSQASERQEHIIKVCTNISLTSGQYADLMARPGNQVVIVNEDTISNMTKSRGPIHCQTSMDSLAYMVFTSGSTGKPKGILINHRALATSSTHHGKGFGYENRAKVLHFSSYAFDAFVPEILTTLLYGGCVCVPSESDRLGDLGGYIARNNISTVILTPSVARLLPSDVVQGIKFLALCGEAPTEKDLQHLSQAQNLFNAYGPAEATVCCAVGRVKLSQPTSFIGKAIGSSLWVVAPEDHNSLVPIGAVGELLIEGSILARGYAGQPDLTSEKFVQNPKWMSRDTFNKADTRLYKTGDLVKYTKDGSLIYLGRKDTQVKIRGQRLELSDVEHNLQECFDNCHVVSEMVLLGGADEKPVLAAFIAGQMEQTQVLLEAEPGVQLVRVSSAIETSLARKLPSYMIPSLYFHVDSIPLSASGKADRKALRAKAAMLSALELTKLESSATKRQPTTTQEQLLREIWAQFLAIETVSIGMDDSFVRLGGDSISAMMVVAEARKHGFEIGVTDVLHEPSLQYLTDKIRSPRLDSNDIPVSNIVGPIEQSYAQGRLWFLDQLYPNSTMYLMPFAVRLRGILDIKALEVALNAIECRHETLRTTFAAQNSQDLQVVHPFNPTELTVVDMNGDEAKFAQALRVEQTTTFNLKTDVGWRLKLFRLNGEDHILSIVMHHIISDGWSVSVLQNELTSFYASAIKGKDPLSSVKPLSIQYKDYALWQKSPPQMEEHNRQLQYWTKQLEDSQPAELLCDKPRPSVLSGQAKLAELIIEGSLYDKLHVFCKKYSVTPFIVLLAAFRATHYRMTGSQDATIGTANANRGLWQLKDMIGFFVNMQCLRLPVNDHGSFEDLIQSVKAVTKESLDNQDVPFEQIVAQLKKEQNRDLARQPLVQVVFTLHSQSDLGNFTLDNVQAEPMHLATTSRFDLEFHFSQEDGRLKGEVAFSTDLYDANTIEGMLRLFQTILAQGLEQPGKAIDEMQLVDDKELSVLDDFGLLHMEETSYPHDSSLPEIFRKAATLHPERVAIKDDRKILTYAELDRDSDNLSQWMLSQGCRNEQLVGVYSPRCCQTVVAYLGILKANLAYVPLDIRSPRSRIETILSAIDGKKLVLLGPGTEAFDHVSDTIQWANIDEVLQLRPHTNLSPQEFPSATSLAYVMFTSGSTGTPKGVQITHRGILRLTMNNNLVKHFPETIVTAHMGNIAFDITVWEIYSTLMNGGTLVCIDHEKILDNRALADIFIRNRITNAIFTPALFTQCLLEHPELISQLRVLLVGGDKVDATDLMTARAIMDKSSLCANAYGPTENSVISTFYLPQESDTFPNGVPIGRALSNSGAYVVDAQLNLLPMGVIGELVVTGGGLARGYTQATLNHNRFVILDINGQQTRAYRTGDYVRYRPSDGQMEFFGRVDGQVKIRGHRIELGEIESALRTHTHVKDAVTVSAKLGELAPQLAAFVTIRDDTEDEEDEAHSDAAADGSEAAAAHVKLWEHLFDTDKYTTVEDVRPESVGRDFTSWTSMYDGTLIDEGEMNEWLDDTMDGILNGQDAGHVLEVGTGTGMILFNLINSGLNSYVGLDPAATAIEFVSKTIQSVPDAAEKIYVQRGTAMDINRLAKTNSPNLVVINSVAQYFPTQAYLFRVVNDLVRLDGVERIHFGDMRSWALYRQFTVSKALHILGSSATKKQVQQKMAELAQVESEMLVDPAFFTALVDQLPEYVQHVEILPKRMKATNELSCYRYAAVLHLRNKTNPLKVHHIEDGSWVDFKKQDLDRAALRQLLQERRSTSMPVALTHIPYQKTALETSIVESVTPAPKDQLNDATWLTSMKDAVNNLKSLSALDLENLAKEMGYRVDISWARQYTSSGALDVVFHHHTPPLGNRCLFNFPGDHGSGSRQLTSRPLQQRMAQKIRSQLQERLQELLPPYMVPQTITILDKIPVTENGKTDRKMLLQSISTVSVTQETKQQPRSDIERKLQNIWAEVLYMNPTTIGVEDSFFQLGGDSITAMKVVAQARKMGIALAVADIFKYPTLAEQASTRTNSVANTVTRAIEPFSLLESHEEDIRDELARLCNTEPSMVQDAYPCTSLQEGLISLTAKRPGDYTMQAILQISDDVDIVKFKEAWDSVIASTDILRTRIVQHDKYGFVQVVCDRPSHDWVEVSDMDSYLEHDRLMPMELGNALSHYGIAEKDGKRYLVWSIHHSLYDGWSLPRVMTRVSEMYHSQTPAHSTPFNTFVKYLLDSNKDDTKAYWQSYLAGLGSTPFPAMPPSIREPVANTVVETSFKITSPNSEVTTSTMIRGALALLISEYQNSVDVLFGSVVSGRNAPVDNIDDILGPTIATLPIRTIIDKKLPVSEYLKAIQRESTDCIEHEQIGLQQIASMGPEGRRACEFQTLLVIQPKESGSGGEKTLGNWQAASNDKGFSSTYAMVLECFLDANEVAIRASIDTRAITTHQVERLTSQMSLVLQQFSESSNMTLGEIDTLTPEDRTTLHSWNKTVPGSMDNCAHAIVSERARTQPDAKAIDGWDGQLTYSELENFSGKLAWYLSTLGIRNGSIVPLCFEKSVWTIVAALAVLKTGSAFLLLDVTQPADRRDQILQDIDTEIILTSFESAQVVSNPCYKTILISPEIIESLPEPTTFATAETCESLAYIIYTSGSTGKPKGVMVSHRSLCTSSFHHGNAFAFSKNTRAIQFSGYSFDACIMEIFTTLMFGGCVCVPSESERLSATEDVISRLGANLFFMTPTVAKLLNPDRLPSLETIILGGEAVSNDDLRLWNTRTRKSFSAYGPSECTIICAAGDVESLQEKSGSHFGRPKGGVFWIVSTDDPDRLLPIGAAGELYIEGAIVSNGYLGKSDLTSSSFIKSPMWLSDFGREGTMYKTGDLVRYNDDGTLTHLGRKDTQVKIRGQRIELGEVEHHLKECIPSVTSAVAEVITLIGETDGRHILSAFLKMDDRSDPHDITEITENISLISLRPEDKTKLSQKLPAYMIPSVYFCIEHMPLAASGKLDRRKLREQIEQVLSSQQLAEMQSQDQQQSKRQPRTDTEKSLQALWAITLGISTDAIGIDDSFTTLGGDSISAMKLVVKAREHQFALTVSEIFKYSTLSDLAIHLDEKCRDNISIVSADPFSLLDPEIKEGVIYASGSQLKYDIADIYPVTSFQKSVIHMSLQWQTQSLNYIYLDLGTNIDIEKLKDSCSQVVEVFSALRSVFVSYQEKYFQVVLEDITIPFQTLDVEGISDSQQICERQLSNGFQFGRLLTNFMLVRSKSQEHRLIIRLSHTQYDGMSLPVLITALLDIYQDKKLQPMTEFSDYIFHKQSQKLASLTYWKSLLQESTPTSVSSFLMDKEVQAMTLDKIPEPAIGVKSTTLPQLPQGITLASVMSAAWAVVLSQTTGKQDVVYGALVTGRDESMPGIENVMAPCVSHVPVRAQILPNSTPRDLVDSLQQQSLAANTYCIDLDHLFKEMSWQSDESDFDSLFQHQGVEETPVFDMSGQSVQLSWFDNPHQCPPRLVIMSYPTDNGVKVRVMANTHITTPAIAQKIANSICVAASNILSAKQGATLSSNVTASAGLSVVA